MSHTLIRSQLETSLARDRARADWWERIGPRRDPNSSFDAGFEAALSLVQAGRPIATAPDLLAALKGLCQHSRPSNWDERDDIGGIDGGPDAWRAADAAIAQAEPPPAAQALPIKTCSKCGAKAVAFVCAVQGCPVNGGAVS